MHGCDPNLAIAITPDSPNALAAKYTSVTLLGHNSNPYSMPFERRNIYLLHGRKLSAPFHWEDERFYY